MAGGGRAQASSISWFRLRVFDMPSTQFLVRVCAKTGKVSGSGGGARAQRWRSIRKLCKRAATTACVCGCVLCARKAQLLAVAVWFNCIISYRVAHTHAPANYTQKQRNITATTAITRCNYGCTRAGWRFYSAPSVGVFIVYAVNAKKIIKRI